MFDVYLRSNTNRLQDDLRCTMKSYHSDKQRLVAELSNLRSSERSSTSMSLESSGQWSNSTDMMSRKSTYFRAPNMAATSSAQKESFLPSADSRWREKREHERIKKEKDMLRLPVIHSAQSTRSDWESGRNLSFKSEPVSKVEPLPGIAAAKALLKETMKIPCIYDPQRSDKKFDTHKNKNGNKKVTFADEKSVPLLSVNEIVTEGNLNLSQTKNSQRDKSLVPSLSLSKNHFQPMLRPRRPRKTALPPLNLSLNEIRNNPQRVTEGVNEWKSLYGNIVNPEERTKALADILYAVRVKKYENEQAMKYGDSPRSARSEGRAPSEHLLATSNDKILYRDETGQKILRASNGLDPDQARLFVGPDLGPNQYVKDISDDKSRHLRKIKGIIPKNMTPRGNQRYSSFQLQNYLRHMSRQRKIMEQIAADEYRRLYQISKNKAVKEVTQTQAPVKA